MHVLVTGASSGIGEAIAREFAAIDGARLTLVARRREKLVALANSLPCPTHVAVADLSDAQQLEWLDEAIARHGPVEVLVNNAGAQVIGPTVSVDPNRGEGSVALNLFAPIRLIQAVLPAMLQQGAGHIVNIASMAALAPTPAMSYYNASKAGLAAMSEALGGELRGTGIGVLTVYPGIIAETDLAARALATYSPSRLLSLQPTGTATTLASRVRRSALAGRKRLVYPKVNALAGWFPRTTRWLMDRATPPLRDTTAAQ